MRLHPLLFIAHPPFNEGAQTEISSVADWRCFPLIFFLMSAWGLWMGLFQKWFGLGSIIKLVVVLQISMIYNFVSYINTFKIKYEKICFLNTFTQLSRFPTFCLLSQDSNSEWRLSSCKCISNQSVCLYSLMKWTDALMLYSTGFHQLSVCTDVLFCPSQCPLQNRFTVY